MKLYFTLFNFLLFLSFTIAQSPQLDPANSCNVTATNINDVINAQVITGANKYRFNISYDNDPANDIIHERGNSTKSHWTQLYRIDGQLASTHPLKNKMEYFGREYSTLLLMLPFDNKHMDHWFHHLYLELP